MDESVIIKSVVRLNNKHCQEGRLVMKTFAKLISLALVLVMMACALTACGNTLSGTYTAKDDESSVSFTFNGDKVTLKIEYDEEDYSEKFKGTYEINDDGDEITFDFEDAIDDLDDDDLFGAIILEGLNGEDVEFKKGDNYIKINGEKFKKK